MLHAINSRDWKHRYYSSATMAHFIQASLAPGQTLLHLNGSYRSDHHDGIAAYLRQYAPKLRIGTLSVVTQEQLNVADYVVVSADVPKTY